MSHFRWRLVKKILIGIAVAVLVLLGIAVWRIGPRNVIGMIRYDQRREGDLQIGQRAPDVPLVSLDGRSPVSLGEQIGGKPLVLVFGSYT